MKFTTKSSIIHGLNFLWEYCLSILNRWQHNSVRFSIPIHCLDIQGKCCVLCPICFKVNQFLMCLKLFVFSFLIICRTHLLHIAHTNAESPLETRRWKLDFESIFELISFFFHRWVNMRNVTEFNFKPFFDKKPLFLASKKWQWRQFIHKFSSVSSELWDLEKWTRIGVHWNRMNFKADYFHTSMEMDGIGWDWIGLD